MSTRKKFTDALKEYLAPAGIGAIAGVVATMATVVPQIFDKTQQVIEQQRHLNEIERDISAYSKVIRKMYPLLSTEQLADLFEDKGKVLINVDKGRMSNDSLISAELRQSPEGAYFVWCRTGMNSAYAGVSLGFWLTRREALAWASEFATAGEFKEVFGDEAFKSIDKTIQVPLCD